MEKEVENKIPLLKWNFICLCLVEKFKVRARSTTPLFFIENCPLYFPYKYTIFYLIFPLHDRIFKYISLLFQFKQTQPKCSNSLEVATGAPGQTHLLYTDDLIIYGKVDLDQIHCIIKEYAKCSG